MSHVFFSYSRANSDIAAKIVQGLRANGFAVWQDVSALRGGDSWQIAIQNGIAEASAFIVLWSKEASQSEWVSQEVQLAGTHSGKSLIPLWLDDTKLGLGLSTKHAISLKQGVDRGLEELIEALPQDSRRQRLGFDPKRPLGDQSVDKVGPWQVNDTELVAAPLLTSSYCKAYVVGKPDTVIGSPEVVQLCLQFSRKPEEAPIPDVYQFYESLDEAERPNTFVGLYITGPFNVTRQAYRIDDGNPAQWTDSVDTVMESIHDISRLSSRPLLQVFPLMTVPLALALGMKLWRFWHVQIHNYVGGKYIRVLDIPPDQ